jgi:hypothetical protein
LDIPASQHQTQRSTNPRIRPFPVSPDTPITGSIAQKYLSHLLRLPENRQFPPELALQILTHKSYRYVHAIRHERAGLASEPSSTAHNSRLSFLGRRAIASYLALFVHEAIGTSTQLKDMDFLKGRTLEEKLEALRHLNNLGREVAGPWDISSVLRYDRNDVCLLLNLSVYVTDDPDWYRIWACQDQGYGSRVGIWRDLYTIRITSGSPSIPYAVATVPQQSIPGSRIAGEDRNYTEKHREGIQWYLAAMRTYISIYHEHHAAFIVQFQPHHRSLGPMTRSAILGLEVIQSCCICIYT